MQAQETSALRRLLWEKLMSEGETDLAVKLGSCGQPVPLRCMSCGGRRLAHSRCKRKWCPCCQRSIAAKRAARLRVAMVRIKWPLFLTLTMPNASYDDPGQIRHLRRSFGKLRHRRVWREQVTGGCAAIEVTDTGHGWHFHLHALIDCRWLSITVKPPNVRDSAHQKAILCRAAQREFAAVWADCCGVPVAHCWVKRVTGDDITAEVVKYSVKGSDLLESSQPIGDLIRAIDATRLTTSFGSLFGITAELDDDAQTGCDCEGCGDRNWLPDDIARLLTARTKDLRGAAMIDNMVHRRPNRPPPLAGHLDLTP